MAAGKYNFKLEQGVDFERAFTRKVKSTGLPVNYTGFTGRMQVRSDHADKKVWLELTTANGGMVIDGAAGKVTITMTNAQTSALKLDKAIYDIELISGVGKVMRFLEGQITIKPEATR